MKIFIFKSIQACITLLLLLFFQQAYASSSVPASVSLSGTSLVSGAKLTPYVPAMGAFVSSSTLSGAFWATPSTTDVNSILSIMANYDILKSKAYIKLRVKDLAKDANLCLPDKFTYTVVIKYKKMSTAGVYDVNESQVQLVVDYNKGQGLKYKNLDAFQIDNVLLLSCNVVSAVATNTSVNVNNFVELVSEIEYDHLPKPTFFASAANIATSAGTPLREVTPQLCLFTPLLSVQFDNNTTKENIVITAAIRDNTNTPLIENSGNGYGTIKQFSIDNYMYFSNWIDSIELQWTFTEEEYYSYSQSLSGYTVTQITDEYSVDFNKYTVSVILPYPLGAGANNNYKISNIFEKGRVAFRARFLGRVAVKNNNNEITDVRMVACPWSGELPNYPLKAKILGSNAEAFAFAPAIKVDTYKPKFNWIYNCSFAEDGKKNESIAYFDGTLKARQTIARSSTNSDFVLIKETIYDFQGRPAIEVLPTPTQPNSLSFVPNFNKSATGLAYQAADFDYNSSSNACETVTAGMLTTSGAAKYYSSENSWLTGSSVSNIHQYIPTSGNTTTGFYPFSQTIYTPDNTGRVSISTQVGNSFKLGSGKESKYFYGRPDQSELDRLFGADVGLASHYSKEMVRDANGQFAVTIKDLSGKVVVSALAGDVPTNLQPLASATSQEPIEADLLEYGQAEIPDGYLLTAPFTVVKDQDFEFKYSLNPETYTKLCNGSNLYCLDCVYDLEISIVNDCNEEFLRGDKLQPSLFTPIVRRVGPTAINGVCEGANAGYNTSDVTENLVQKTSNTSTILINLPKGNYFINRRITINKQAREEYLRNIVALNPCKTLAQFETEERAKVNLSQCHPCDAYMAAKKKGGNIRQHYINDVYTARFEQGPPVSTTPEEVLARKEQIGLEYDAAKLNCDVNADPCKVYESTILADVTPGGLYANIDNNVTSNYSVFKPKAGYPIYTNIPFFNDPANAINGVPLNALSLENLAENWKPAYAVPLMVLHPEYYQYKVCRDLEESKNFDLAFLSAKDYKEAKDLKYFDDISTTGNKDPFVIANTTNGYTELTSSQATNFKTAINTNVWVGLDPSKSSEVGISGLKSLVAYTAFCKDANDRATCITNALANVDNCDYKAKNLFWITYKSTYQAIKTRAYETYLAGYRTSSALVPSLSNSYASMYGLLDVNNIRFGELKPVGAFDKDTEIKAYEKTVVDNCLKSCESMADGWIGQLNKCTFSSDAQKAALRTALINVCKGGCDKNNPYGASSVKPGYSNIDRSFEDVFVRLGLAYTPDCNASIINFPKEYDEKGSITDVKNNPIYTLQNDLCAIGINPCILFGNCVEGLTTSETNACSILSQANNADIKKMVNAIDTMNCQNGNCITCSKFRELYQEYYNQPTEYRINNNLASFINKKLGFALTVDEYADFMAKCLGYETTPIDVGFTPESYVYPYTTLETEYRQAYLIYRPTATSYTFAQLSKEKYYDVWNIDTKIASQSKWIKAEYTHQIRENLLKAVETRTPILTASIDGTYISETEKEKGFAFTPLTQVQIEGNGEPAIDLDKMADNSTLSAPVSFAGKAAPFGIRKVQTVNVLDVCSTLDYLVGKYFGYNTIGMVTLAQYNALYDDEVALQGVSVEIMRWYYGALNSQDKLALFITENRITTWQAFKQRLQYLLCMCGKVSSSKCGGDGQCRPCMQLQNDFYSFTGLPDADIKDIFNSSSTDYRNLLLGFYNDVQTKCYANQFVQLSSSQVTYDNVQTWLKDILCKCGINTSYCAEELVKCKSGENSANCFLPNNRVLALQSLLQEIVLGGQSCNLPPPGGATHNRLAGTYKCFSLAATNLVALFGSAAASAPSGTELSYNATAYTAGNVKEVIAKLVLANVAGFNSPSFDERRSIRLSMIEDNVNIDFSKIDHIYNLVPVYLPNINGGTNWFAMKARAKYTVAGQIYSKTVYITGHFEDAITRSVTCAVKCAKLCRKPMEVEDPCEAELIQRAKDIAFFNYQSALLNTIEQERINYNQKCLGALKSNEQFKKIYNDNQYHYTLYYYDAAGNLLKTVPPKGVKPLSTAQVNAIKAARAIDLQNYNNREVNTYTALTVPASTNNPHELVTQYQYNTLNQLVWQSTPDAGISKFGYDRLGRLIVSQNAKQIVGNFHSYTLFDKLGRITEVGELTSVTLNNAYNDPAFLENTSNTNTHIVNNTQKGQITRTFYDSDPSSGITYNLSNTRGRIAKVAYWATYPSSSTDLPRHAAMYSYDIQGNVKQLYRYTQSLGILGQELKCVNYDFDVISGKVEKLTYQQNKADQYIHQYKYDAENRLVKSYSAPRQELIDEYPAPTFNDIGLDASYEYYNHGPLARTELGELKVQGIDYAYTLQGWLKGVNSIALQGKTDMGKDGFAPAVGQSNTHTGVAKDEFGYMLNYFEGDYQQIQNYTPGSTTTAYPSDWLWSGASNASSFLATSQKPLYNGNISQMVTAIGKFMTYGKPLASNYEYDQLNRITSAKYVNNFDISSNTWENTGSFLTDWQNTFTYDENGNILTQERNGAGSLTAMDNLTYKYHANSNKLRYVKDNAAANSYTDDVDDQEIVADGVNTINYTYDAIGNLQTDAAEKITNIAWNLYGKISKITRSSPKSDIEYEYTPDGHRAVKITIPKDANQPRIYTYYMRDAQGNILATYERQFNKIVDYNAISYANLNTKLIDDLGINAFASFMADKHVNNPILKTNLYNSIVGNTTYKTDYYNQSSVNAYLIDGDNLSIANATIAAYSNAHFMAALLQNTSINIAVDFGSKMQARKNNNNNEANLAEYLFGNTAYRNLFFTDLFNNYTEDFNNILYDLDLTPTGKIEDDLTALDNFVGNSARLNDLIAKCEAHIGLLTNSSSNTAMLTINNLYSTNTDFKDAIHAIVELKELFYTSQNSALNAFSASQLPLATVINYLENYNNTLLKAKALTAMGNESTFIMWEKNAHAVNFITRAIGIEQSTVAAFQLSTKPYCTGTCVESGIGIKEYFTSIKSFYGQSATDQILNAYLISTNNNLYVDKISLKEWHIYGSSRLGIYRANIAIASRQLNSTSINQGSGTEITGTLVKTELVFYALSQTRGNKNYELSNHLGNVLAVVNDKKTYNCGKNELINANFDNGSFNNLFPSSTAATMNLTGSKLNITCTANNAQVGGLFDIEGQAGKTYQVSFNFTKDGSLSDVWLDINANYNSAGGGLRQNITYMGSNTNISYTFTAPQGVYRYKFGSVGTGTFSIDNFVVKEVITEGSYAAEVLTANDYSPFGAPMAGRSYKADNILVKNTVSTSNFTTGVDGWQPAIANVFGANVSLSNVHGNIRATLVSGGVNQGMKKVFATEPNKTYSIKFKINLRGWPNMYVKDVATTNTLLSYTDFMTPGNYTYVFTATGYQTQVEFLEVAAPNGSIQLCYFTLEEVETENGYRFGAGTQEKDDDIFIGAYTAEYWEYDSRLGRRWNVDPVVYPWQSSYAVFNNCPIAFNDPQGLEGKPTDGGGVHYEKKTKAGTFISNLGKNVGTFITSRLWRWITFRSADRFAYNSLKEARWKKVSDNYSGWFGSAVKSTVNFFKRLFGSSSGNHITIPSGKWVVSDWIELEATQRGNKYFYSMPTSISSEKLWNTRILVNYTNVSDAGYFPLTGDVGGSEIPMYASTRIPFDPVGRLNIDIIGGPTSLINNNFFYNIFKNGLSSPTLKAGAAVMLNGIADIFGGFPNNPIFRKTTAFTITAHTNSVGYQVHFFVKVKQYVPVNDITRSRLFRWYHGLQKQ